MMNMREMCLPAAAALLAATFVITGCGAQHPDDATAVYSKLDKNDLRSVTVAQDRHSGQMTLHGIVSSDSQKTLAMNLARQAAPGYTISNQIQVHVAGFEPSASQSAATSPQDLAIEHHYRAKIDAHRNLRAQHIKYTASNGTLVLEGTVKTRAEAQEAARLAKQLPNVQKVVNDLTVRPAHRANANS